MKFFCIADEETLRGFALAGVAGVVASTPSEAIAALTGAAATGECGIIIITDCLAAAISQELDTLRSENRPPLVLEIPGPNEFDGRKTLTKLVQQAIGIHIGAE